MSFKSNAVSLVAFFGHQASEITPFGVYIRSKRFGNISPAAPAPRFLPAAGRPNDADGTNFDIIPTVLLAFVSG